jgi:hypothetical protein
MVRFPKLPCLRATPARRAASRWVRPSSSRRRFKCSGNLDGSGVAEQDDDSLPRASGRRGAVVFPIPVGFERHSQALGRLPLPKTQVVPSFSKVIAKRPRLKSWYKEFQRLKLHRRPWQKGNAEMRG